jgi:hypothetical protein
MKNKKKLWMYTCNLYLIIFNPRFISSALETKGITGEAASEVLKKLNAAQIVSIDLLKNLSHFDWEKTGVSVGAARAVQDALWAMKHDANEAKVEKTLKLRRESSSRTDMKQKRL